MTFLNLSFGKENIMSSKEMKNVLRTPGQPSENLTRSKQVWKENTKKKKKP